LSSLARAKQDRMRSFRAKMSVKLQSYNFPTEESI
jgi:hypothetical protein